MNVSAPLCFLALTAACLAADLAPISEGDLTPDLVAAINAQNPERVHQLLASGVPASAVSADGDTPLCAALRLGQADIAKELLEHGADATACGYDHQPPIVLASLRRNPEVMKLLLDGGANANVTVATPVAPALLENLNEGLLRGLLRHERRITPLMACACRGDVESIALLVSHKANAELQTSPNRWSALDLAAQNGYLYVMRLLLGRDPDSEPKVLVTVSLAKQMATLEVEGKLQFKTTISTGRAGFATPAGRYVVTHKYKEWKSTVYKVSMPFFMRLNSGDFGMHSGYVTGSPASHGCIRLPDAMARKFFDTITVGDEVVIEP
jgi:hypothetical protein